ncbi:hypothetical protein ACWDUL_20340 [Nocardia niigatensis]
MPIPATLGAAARRTLQLLAVDQQETEEAASAELADTAVAAEIAQLALSIPAPQDEAVAVEFGATLHAVLPGTGDVDVICLGTPVWLRAAEPESP